MPLGFTATTEYNGENGERVVAKASQSNVWKTGAGQQKVETVEIQKRYLASGCADAGQRWWCLS